MEPSLNVVSLVSLPLAFAAFDWVVLAVYATLLLGIGLYFYQRQVGRNEEFFVGNRRTHPLLAGISMFTALTSIITYIGTSGEYIQYGPVLVFFANFATLPLVLLIVGWFLIPVFMRLPITSVYELLEPRLGLVVRRTGSLTYVVTRLVWMALILFTCSKVLVYVTSCDPRWIAPISLAASLAAGCLFSLWKTRGRSAAALLGYSVAGLLPLAVSCVLLLRSAP